MKIVFGIIATIVFVVLGVVIISPDSKPDTPQNNTPISNNNTNKTADPITDLVIGKTDAKATIIEYGDFKCPSCGQFHQEAGKQLRSEYIDGGKLKIVFRPLAIIGPDSERSAVGAYCANNQSKFAPYHDAVYDHMWNNYYKSGNFSAEFKDILTAEKLNEIATNAGLDSAGFSDCLSKAEAVQEVADNLKNAEADGLRGTPTFKIGDQIVTGPQPFSTFKTLVDIQLR